LHQITKPTESYTKKKINPSSIYSTHDQNEEKDRIGFTKGEKELCKIFLGRTLNERDNLSHLSVPVYGKILKFIPY